MTTAITCRHHWVIESPDARVGNTRLFAVCKLCDATRTFPKFHEHDWGGRAAAWRHLKDGR
jgi:hypothetical protein